MNEKEKEFIKNLDTSARGGAWPSFRPSEKKKLFELLFEIRDKVLK